MPSPETIRPDLCVIGGGAAGSAVALAAAGLGLSCVLVEKRLPLGRGLARDRVLDGLVAAERGEDFALVRERIGRRIASAAPAHAAERLRATGTRIIEATGRFTDGTTVAAGNVSIRARRFVLATGALPVAPAVPGLDVVRYRTLLSLHEFERVPERLAVIGAASQAFELAQAFRRLGSAVTLIGGPYATDPELWEVVAAAFRRDGVDLRSGPVIRVEPRGTGAVIHLGGAAPTAVDVTDILVADGDRAVTEGLGLDQAGVARRDGSLVLRPNLQTGNRRVFAVGDVLGPAGAGPAGLPAQVGTVLRAAFLRQPVRYAPEQVARVLRTVPPLAETGWSEAEARARVRKVRLFRAPLADVERGLVAEGHVKVLATPGGRVLGAGVVGPRAEELIVPWVLAVTQGLPLGAVATAPFAQPSLSDASRRAALAHVVARLRSPWVRRALALARRFG